ncbi:MAG: DNA-processing protein DprA [Bacillota bacterium]
MEPTILKIAQHLSKSNNPSVENGKVSPLPVQTAYAEDISPDYVGQARRLMEQCSSLGIDIITIEDPEYPENLRQTADPPSILFVKGSIIPKDRMAVAVVGTRKASSIGKSIAQEICYDLAEAGVTIISGLAYGIDACAHEAALSANGRTIACLGNSPDIVYPKSNYNLYSRIPSSGALLSEYPPGTEAKPWHFPKRNRLISGVSLGVLVVEAGEKSGALITADWALKQDRPVMAVPGSIKSRNSRGTNRLIQDGAYLVTCAEDVLSFLRKENEYLPEISESTAIGSLTLEESLVLNALGYSETLDELCNNIDNMPVSRILAILSCLEVRGIVQSIPGGKYIISNLGSKSI